MANPTLPIRAESDSKFYRRFILLGVGAMAFAAYCVYDGAIAYPKKQKVYRAYQEIPELDRVEKWPTVAAEHGWPSDIAIPKKEYSDGDILLQFVMAVPISLAGLWFLFGVWRARGSWIEVDEQGIRSSSGHRFGWDDVTQLDKKKWRNKGIAKVHYSVDNRSKSYVIDDYKFVREPTDAILRELENRIDHSLIVNGPTEVEVEEAEQATSVATG